MPRKIIQFSFDPEGDLIVLCDDGSMWWFEEDKIYGNSWGPYCSPIPQDNEANAQGE